MWCVRTCVLAFVCVIAVPRQSATQTAAIAAADTARTGPPRRMRAVRRSGVIKLDGKLDDAAWALAPTSSDFVQSYPSPNAPATDVTQVRILYDDDALWVGVRMFDAHPDSIASQLARRDVQGIYSDWVHVMIDSYHDRRTAFRFTVNPRGVKTDVLEYNENSEDVNWDAVWDVATSVDSLGWVAEYRIPLSQLRFGSAPADGERVWGLQVMRDVARRNERDSWAPWTPQAGAFVSRFGDLTGIVGVPAPIHAELLPYASSRLTRAPDDPGNPFYKANDHKPSIGGDFKVGLPKGLTLNGAINPDFGQVEVDPAVVNLSAYETFFPEKRPFFIEGAGIFSFGQTRTYNNFQFQQYFYSRRIGRSPTRSIDAPFVDAPEATRISGAAKLSGRVGAWTVGMIDALTSRENAAYRMAAAGPTQQAVVEPLSNYFVGRLRRDFRGGQTQIGGELTATHRALGDTAFAGLLRDRALFGGIDFEHGWDKGAWYLTGYVGHTEVSGARAAIAATQRTSTHYYQRPDAGYIRFDSTRTRLGGSNAEIALQRNGPVYGSFSYKTVSPGFEINDLGFQGRSDYQALSEDVGFQSFKAGRIFQNIGYGLFTNEAWNQGGMLIFNGGGFYSDLTLTNFWQLHMSGSTSASALSDRLTRGGALARTPGNSNIFVNVATDTRRPVSLGATLNGGVTSFDGGKSLSPSLSVRVRPASSVLVTVGPSFSTLFSSNQYIRTVDDPLATATYAQRYVFGELHQTTLSADTRVNVTFTPSLSLEMYAQPFVSTGRYARFKQLSRPSTAEYAVYGSGQSVVVFDGKENTYTVDPDGSGPAKPFAVANPDFDIHSLRGNAVVRWEYRPGSTLYVVWQQARSGSGTNGEFDFNRDVHAIFREPVTNVLLVKLTYWLGV
jgi:hypothetical protein